MMRSISQLVAGAFLVLAGAAVAAPPGARPAPRPGYTAQPKQTKLLLKGPGFQFVIEAQGSSPVSISKGVVKVPMTARYDVGNPLNKPAIPKGTQARFEGGLYLAKGAAHGVLNMVLWGRSETNKDFVASFSFVQTGENTFTGAGLDPERTVPASFTLDRLK